MAKLVLVFSVLLTLAAADRPQQQQQQRHQPQQQQQQQRPSYQPPQQQQQQQQQQQPYHIPKRECSVDFEKRESEICVPSLSTTCSEETVTLKAPVQTEKCLTIPMVTCKAEVREEEIEICVYVYEKKDLETEAKVADVKYVKNCETEYVEKCEEKPKPKYTPYKSNSSNGNGYSKDDDDKICKEIPVETCYNRPNTESKEQSVTVSVPQPVKKCEKKRIQIPDVQCEESTEERCFNLVSLEDTEMTVEKCQTELAEPRCNKVSLQLPAQTCKEELQRYGYGGK